MDSPAPAMPTPLPAAARIDAVIEAALRAAVIREAMSWVGTPYANCASVKGGAVDCAMLLVRCWVDAGVFAPFDPRPYPPHWHVHHTEERYLAWMHTLAHEVPVPQPGDVGLWHFGRCFSHGGIIVSPGVVCSASAIHGKCTLNDVNEAWLAYERGRGAAPRARPVRWFDVFAPLRGDGA